MPLKAPTAAAIPKNAPAIASTIAMLALTHVQETPNLLGTASVASGSVSSTLIDERDIVPSALLITWNDKQGYARKDSKGKVQCSRRLKLNATA